MNILKALDDAKLLGGAIRDADSWRPWRAFLGALFGLELSQAGEDIYRACTGRVGLPEEAFNVAWLVCGRRSGKSFVMAVIAVYLAAFRDWRQRLSPGERAVILLVAADREQAKILRRYIGGILEAPVLAQLVESETAETIELNNRVVIEVVTCSYRTVRGRSVCVALLDEVAFWRRDDSVNPDIEVFNAIRASMATFGDDAMMIVGSSPYSRRGVLWDAWRKYFGKPDGKNLVWQAPTRTMNPSVPQAFIDDEFERDPASAAAEYGAQFRSDIAEFVSLDIIESCISDGVFEIAPLPDVRYVAFVDPSGGSSDSFTLAIAHREPDGAATLDLIREVKPPFSPESVVEDFCQTLAAYRVGRVHGDRYAGEWPREQFKKRGIDYMPSEKVKSEIYLAALPLLNSGKVQLLDNKRLVQQLHGLERKTARGGKDSVDHGPSGKDDVANCVCGALVLASHYTQPLTFHVPTTGPSRSTIASLNFDPAVGYSSSPLGGWPIGSVKASSASPATVGGFGHLGWSAKQ